MDNPPLKQLFFIVNPISGCRKQRNLEKCLDRYLDKQQFVYRIAVTTGPGEATGIARSAIQEGADAIIAVGGDGTVNEVARGILESSVPLGIIPTGSGNGLARHLRIPVSLKKSIQIINRFSLKRIDTATLNENLFLSVAGAGFDAKVAQKFAIASRRGFWSYFWITLTSYFRYSPEEYRMTIDGEVVERRALLISFANSSQFGNNTSIDPGASLEDGFIDVCIVKKVPSWKVMFLAPLLFLKQFDKTEYVEIFRAREVILTRTHGKSVHLDGDPMKIGREFTMKIHPRSLVVLVP